MLVADSVGCVVTEASCMSGGKVLSTFFAVIMVRHASTHNDQPTPRTHTPPAGSKPSLRTSHSVIPPLTCPSLPVV